MSVILFANIGNSDLQIDGKRPQNPRVEGQAAFEHFAKHQFDLTIIEPCVREVLRDHATIARVVLFFTDQQATPESLQTDRYSVALRDKDTIWFAQIIARALEERFTGQVVSTTLVRTARTDGGQFNPSMPDEAFDVFGQLLPRFYGDSTEQAFVLMSGGLPACNNALQLHVLAYYGERCAMLYKPETKDPIEQRVGAQLQQVFQRNAALGALERQNFAAALALVESGAASPDVVALLRYATYREAFDFARAGVALREAMRLASGDMRMQIGELRGELDALDRHEMPALLRELALSARIAFTNERYADFLGRVFRFQEAALRYLIEKHLGISTDIGDDHERFFMAVKANLALVEFLSTKTINDRPLHYEMPTIPVLGAALEYMLKDGVRADGSSALNKHERGPLTGLREQLNKIERLSQLRNRSVIAHGFTGISREALEEASGGDARMALDVMQQVVQKLQIERSDTLERLVAVLCDRLRQGGTR